jgi:hypothetical protein
MLCLFLNWNLTRNRALVLLSFRNEEIRGQVAIRGFAEGAKERTSIWADRQAKTVSSEVLTLPIFLGSPWKIEFIGSNFWTELDTKIKSPILKSA